MKQKSLNILILLFLFSCSNNTKRNIETVESYYYPQGYNNRTAAEWEPALGTLIVWPLSIPYKLAIELANDNHLFTMVENEDARKEAEKWFNEWGINQENVTFVYAKQGVDAWWTRDWGPSAIFTRKKEYKLADGKYIYSTPGTDLACNDSLRFLFLDENNKLELTQIDDDATIPLAKQLGFDIMDLPFNNTGGNVLTDGLGTAFSTCVIFAENKYHGIDSKNFLHLNDSLLGFERYNIISNFEKMGIQHIDCLLKLIDEETILVAEPPNDHELYDIYNNIVTNELSVLKSPYNKPYKIVRIKTDRYKDERLAAYTNSLILNKVVYVPLFDIPQDSIALQTWEDAMPGYQIKGFTFALDDEPVVTDELRAHYKSYGWNSGDALHCRTRAIWNPEMLFITVNKIKAEVDSNQNNKVFATIIDYSKQGLVENKTELFWKISGATEWNIIPLLPTNTDNLFSAEIPNHNSGTAIEYYISAVSNSGERETRPITAPIAAYNFLIK
ncbi:agmatine deiminase family protein [Aestuariibaculum marinum]|uniref:Agmatine deiminase family protein n=1 Tax=Aestuariibaculum marinum TaxID=2683592 RepID=A0A8J6Q084_9FLAO|nr:agmatine deiminase family protein [Aestuariibaculum marinum]MBD0822714.1 agmatine deiminase family protein [Aestuariibaculum marinum]